MHILRYTPSTRCDTSGFHITLAAKGGRVDGGVLIPPSTKAEGKRQIVRHQGRPLPDKHNGDRI